jgi:hypothetical protein
VDHLICSPPRSTGGAAMGQIPLAEQYVRHRTSQTQFRRGRRVDTQLSIEVHADQLAAMEKVMQPARQIPATTIRSNRSYGVLTPRPRAPAAVHEPAPGASRRSRASHGGFPGHQRRHRLPHALRRTNRAAVAARAKRILTMRAYLTATGVALGLLAGWVALVPFVA